MKLIDVLEYAMILFGLLTAFLLFGAFCHFVGQAELPVSQRTYTASWLMFWSSCGSSMAALIAGRAALSTSNNGAGG